MHRAQKQNYEDQINSANEGLDERIYKELQY